MRYSEPNKVDPASSELQHISSDRFGICPVCGKEFYMTVVEDWAYHFVNHKSRHRFTCSWSCLNKAKEANKRSRYYGEQYGDTDVY